MVKKNDNPPSGDPNKKVEVAVETYRTLGAQFMCRGAVAMMCPCPVCEVTASADSIIGVACGAAVMALTGKPEMLEELLVAVNKLVQKYPS